MSWQSSRSRRFLALAILLTTPLMLAVAMTSALAKEPCNPILDGTYCATNMPKKTGYVRSSSGMTALEDYSRLVPSAAVGGSSGTLIGIGKQGDRTCFGLLRRSACD
jgi:hypothetical protein